MTHTYVCPSVHQSVWPIEYFLFTFYWENNYLSQFIQGLFGNLPECSEKLSSSLCRLFRLANNLKGLSANFTINLIRIIDQESEICLNSDRKYCRVIKKFGAPARSTSSYWFRPLGRSLHLIFQNHIYGYNLRRLKEILIHDPIKAFDQIL